MARTNKYTSLNFNDIYEKKIINPNSSSTSTTTTTSSRSSSLSSSHKSYSSSASSRLGHGGMLVLSRPSPAKPLPSPPLSPSPQPPPSLAASSSKSASPQSDSISLRPLGKTGSGPTPPLSPLLSQQERETNKETSPSPPVVTPKSDKFVPPHLRPGFVARDQKPVPELTRPSGVRPGMLRPGSGQGYYGSPNRYDDDHGRPKSGGGYERRMRGAAAGVGVGESDLVELNRPRSGGTRTSTSGW